MTDESGVVVDPSTKKPRSSPKTRANFGEYYRLSVLETCCYSASTETTTTVVGGDDDDDASPDPKSDAVPLPGRRSPAVPAPAVPTVSPPAVKRKAGVSDGAVVPESDQPRRRRRPPSADATTTISEATTGTSPAAIAASSSSIIEDGTCGSREEIGEGGGAARSRKTKGGENPRILSSSTRVGSSCSFADSIVAETPDAKKRKKKKVRFEIDGNVLWVRGEDDGGDETTTAEKEPQSAYHSPIGGVLSIGRIARRPSSMKKPRKKRKRIDGVVKGGIARGAIRSRDLFSQLDSLAAPPFGSLA
mmetsp:Transcript_20913/g.49542  ORF Transcript_20913/g.49542 Transcript_20913/m.49542 type:complete len:304 (-) Transcript_20913:1259-2170(-)